MIEGSLWGACALAVIAGAAVIVLPRGGTNRLSISAVPFALAAVSFGANAILHRRARWVSIALYGVGSLAGLYGIVRALSVPARLAVQGVCPPNTSLCPLGFDYPLTSGESTALTVSAVCGVTALLLGFIAAEVQLRPRRAPITFPSDSNQPAL